MKTETGYILVVDDNEMNRDILARRLTTHGHIVDKANDGRQALQMIQETLYQTNAQHYLYLLDMTFSPDYADISYISYL